jgi:inner membrane protein
MTMPRSNGYSDVLRGSQILRLLTIGCLVLVLQIPIMVVSNLVSERQMRRQEAVAEVSGKWGGSQIIAGPALVVPYTVRWTEETSKGRTITRTATHHAVFLPERLKVTGAVKSEIRRRGIYTIPVYRMDLALEGEFARPDFGELAVQPAEIAWGKAQLAVGISDVRAIQKQATAQWDGGPAPFRPGLGTFADVSAGIHAPVVVRPDQGKVAFSFSLSLNGSMSAYFTPFGKSTDVTIQSNYADPSFQGAWLPTDRNVSSKGFTAHWSIPALGRNYAQAWKADAGMAQTVDASKFGVDLVNPIDEYHMVDRSTKYASLFIVLTFGAIWLIEVLAGLRVHPIQYLMLGAALCLFYLLELSLAEHMGFHTAYAIASMAVVGMLGAHCVTVLQRISRALAAAAGTVALYIYLYILLTVEDYALLIGSVGLFAILGMVMYLTRRIDWYGGGPDGRVPPIPPPPPPAPLSFDA